MAISWSHRDVLIIKGLDKLQRRMVFDSDFLWWNYVELWAHEQKIARCAAPVILKKSQQVTHMVTPGGEDFN